MIHEVDEALRAVLERDALGGADVDVVFDAPTKDWAVRRNTPTLDVYLYDIREDLEWRHYGEVDVKAGGRTTGRAHPPRFFRLAYLVTAWTQRPEDEHRLLAAVLLTFLREDHLPRDVVGGVLGEQRALIRTTIGLPPPDDRQVSDVWTALGGELKPSLDLTCLVPIDARGVEDVASLVLEEPRFHFEGPSHSEIRTKRRRAQAASDSEQDVPAASETVAGGTDDQQGRIITIREMT